MRNTAQYPITADEIVAVLNKIPEVNPPGIDGSAMMIGGVDDMIRQGIIAYLTQPDNMARLLESYR